MRNLTILLFALFGMTLMQRFCLAETTDESAAPREKPTIFVVGDSTARNNTNGAQGWGDPFAAYFDPDKAAVLNRAMGEEAVEAMFGPDYVHTSPAGADLNAASVVAGLKAIPDSPFIGLLSDKGEAVETAGVTAANDE